MYYLLLGSIIGYSFSKVPFNTILARIYKHWCVHNTLTKISKTKYELPYHYQGKEYKIIITIKRGPSKIVQIMDENNNDVSSQIKTYLGPNEDFHMTHVTPHSLNHNKLVFHTRSGDIMSFSSEEIITI